MTLLDWLCGCVHGRVSWPQSGWQRCLDCAARRRYRRIGAKPGPWLREQEVVYTEATEEAEIFWPGFTARLKPCPDTNRFAEPEARRAGQLHEEASTGRRAGATRAI